MEEKKTKIIFKKRTFSEEWISCPICKQSTQIKNQIILSMPYCGGCGNIVHDLDQKYCGYCGFEFSGKGSVDSDINTSLIDVSRNKNLKALAKAVAVIYLNDSSDYLPALWSIVEILGDEKIMKQLISNPRIAHIQCQKLIGNPVDED